MTLEQGGESEVFTFQILSNIDITNISYGTIGCEHKHDYYKYGLLKYLKLLKFGEIWEICIGKSSRIQVPKEQH